MKSKKEMDKKKLVLFRHVIDSLLGLEDYLQERDGELEGEFADKMEELYQKAGSILEKNFDKEIVNLLDDTLTVMKGEKKNKNEYKEQAIPVQSEVVCGETEVLHAKQPYQSASEKQTYLETTLLPSRMRLPYLIRQSTKEKIIINRDVFKIGKEKSYVDYFIDNDAVSRNHANIIRQQDSFFVVDQESRNHTYMNGRKIPSKEYIRLESGQHLILANEVFTFYYESI